MLTQVPLFHAQFDTYSYETIRSTAGVRSDLFRRPLSEVRITDFLGGVAHADVIPLPSDVLEPNEENVEMEDSEDETPAFLMSKADDAERKESISKTDGREKNSSMVVKTNTGSQNESHFHAQGTHVETNQRWLDGQVVKAWSSVAIVGGLVAWSALSSSR